MRGYQTFVENPCEVLRDKLFFCLVVLATTPPSHAQEDYKKIFGRDYEQAAAFLAKEKWIGERINGYGLPVDEVLAVVFPELIRFNSIQDKIEVLALESLYIQYGKSYANFSIGRFQIKPSFVEMLENKILESKSPIAVWLKLTPSDTVQNESNRHKRLQKMKRLESAVDYVCAFYAWTEKTQSYWPNLETKIKYLATAYNAGFYLPENEIKKLQNKKFFHVGWVPTKKFCYADVSWCYYESLL